jgi:transglutaminase-like putative cysteine protease
MSLFNNRLLSIFICILYIQPAFAGDPDYNVSAIPAALKEKVHAIKRMEELIINVSSPTEKRVIHRYAITVLDASGDRYARFIDYYDKFRSIRSVSGTLYDAAGKQIKRLKQSDVEDLSGVGGSSLMTDDRIKRHAFYYSVYPHTVEYEIEVKESNTFNFPDWTPQEDEEFSVEKSKLVVTVPQDFTLRYQSFHYKGEPVITTDKNARTYTWEAKDLTPLPDEQFVPDWQRRTTSVLLAPASFEIQQYKGSMNTWEELSRFMYTLNQGRDQLPDDIKQTVHQLTDGLSREEKISKLYRYLQQHTRYISVQLGIGGWQTFDARYVATNGYGDCKALSNYMCALLKEAGVPASCVLVHGGTNEITFEEDFPSNQFNHMIACVPGEKDTTWLECTSTDLPAGYLSGFTDNRPVLIVSEKGSKLIHTPAYTMEQNLQLRNITATVNENGDVLLTANTHYTGLSQDNLQDRLHQLSREKQLEMLKNSLSLPSYDVNKFECKELTAHLPAIDELLEINARNYAGISGKRMFLVPNLLNRSIPQLEQNGPRQSDILKRVSFRDADTVRITVPEGYTPESVPKPVNLQSDFGTYSAHITVMGNKIIYIRNITIKEGLFPATSYPMLEAFYGAINKADRTRMVLVKN